MRHRPPHIEAKGVHDLDCFLSKAVQDGRAPAICAGVTNKEEVVYFGTSGPRVFGHPELGVTDENTTLQLFSSTKLVTTIACLQQVDRGVLSLDDEDLVATHIPELFHHGVLKGYTDLGEPVIEGIKGGITLRQLLTHTSGTTYWHEAEDHNRWAADRGVPMSLGANVDVSAFCTPLAYQPNTRWQYSFGMDWAGILLSRILDTPLEEVFHKFIFEPCGMVSTTFYPTKSIRDRMMGMCGVGADGKLALGSNSPLEILRCMDPTAFGPALSGGGGLFGTARDYLRMLRAILASETEGNPMALLSPSSYQALFTNSVPLTAQIKKDMLRGAIQQNVHPPGLLVGDGENLGHAMGLMLYGVDSEYGRKAGSAFWDGAAKTYYWLDPVTGIAGVCFTNILAQGAIPYNKVYNEFERLVYDHLIQVPCNGKPAGE